MLQDKGHEWAELSQAELLHLLCGYTEQRYRVEAFGAISLFGENRFGHTGNYERRAAAPDNKKKLTVLLSVLVDHNLEVNNT